MKKRIFTLLVAVVFLFPASAALANMVVDFEILTGTLPNGGSIVFENNATGIVATGIVVDRVSLIDDSTSTTVKTIDLKDCTFDFQAGPLVSYDQTNLKWAFQGGGPLVITGDLDGDGQGSMTLLDGTWNSAEVASFGTGSLGIVLGDFTDSKNAWLLYKLGLIDDPGNITTLVGPFDGSLHISFTTATFDKECGFFTSQTVLSGDIDNTYVVPVPAALWLLGSGLIGLIGIRRKIKK